jgi:hypothetical protein
MARATVDVSLRADIKDLVDNLSKVQGVTKKEARAMVREMKKGYDQQIKASKIAADNQIKASKKVGHQAEKTASDMTDVFQKSATEISSVFGVGLLGDFEGLFDVARVSSERFGMGAAAAMTGVGAATAVTVAAIGQYVQGQRELTDEILGTLEANEQFLAPVMLKSLQEMEGTINSINTAYEMLALEGLALASAKTEELLLRSLAFSQMGAPKWMADFAAFVTGPIDKAGKQIAGTFEAVSSSLADVEPDFDNLRGTFSQWGQEIADSAVEIRSGTKSVEDDTKRTDENTASKERNAKAQAALVDVFNDAYAAQMDALDDIDQKQVEVAKSWNDAFDPEKAEQIKVLSEKIGLAASSVKQLTGAASTFANLSLDKFGELADAERDRFEANLEKRTEAQREDIAAQLESGQINQIQADAALERLDLNEERRKKYHKALTKDQQKAAKAAFIAGQAAATADVIMSSATSYMALLTAFAYLGPTAPIAAAAIVGPSVAANMAVIASAKPPQFADGGMVTPDHRMISAQPGEAVISRRGVAALGGPTGIDSLNRGMQSGQNVTANIVLDRRIIGQAVADLVPASMTRRRGRIAVYGG